MAFSVDGTADAPVFVSHSRGRSFSAASYLAILDPIVATCVAKLRITAVTACP